MKKKKRQTIILALAALMIGVGPAAAQKKVNFQSSENGIALAIPNDMQTVKNDETILQLQSKLISFSIHPLFTEKLTEDALAKGISDTAAAAGLEVSKMEEADLKTQTLDGGFFCGDTGNGVNFIVGAVAPIGNDALLFLFTITYAVSTADAVSTLLDSLEFNPDAIQ